jgi:hypothetical protein
MPNLFNPHFNLQPTKDNKAYIILQIVCSDKRIKYSLGLPTIQGIPNKKGGIKYPDWDHHREEVKNHIDSSFNKKIRQIKTFVNEFTEGKDVVPSTDLKNHLLNMTGNGHLIKKEDQKNIFYREVKNLIQDASKGTILNPKNNQKYSAGTLICWTKTMNKLKTYIPELTFNVTMNDYNTFLLKCQEDAKSNSYIGALIKNWKMFMFHTEKKGLHNNEVYKNKDFKQLTDDPCTQVALTLEEIQALRDVELTGKQDIIRDLFVFNCSNGLRISDMESFNENAIINEELGIATMVTEKTDEEIVIDLKEDYFRIKIKHGCEKLPEMPHRNTINREIKDIAKKAKINSIVKVISVKGGNTIVENKEKWRLIKNHTARRTFITLGLKDEDSLTMAAMAGITVQTMNRSYDKRTKLDITLAARERRLKREAEVAA